MCTDNSSAILTSFDFLCRSTQLREIYAGKEYTADHRGWVIDLIELFHFIDLMLRPNIAELTFTLCVVARWDHGFSVYCDYLTFFISLLEARAIFYDPSTLYRFDLCDCRIAGLRLWNASKRNLKIYTLKSSALWYESILFCFLFENCKMLAVSNCALTRDNDSLVDLNSNTNSSSIMIKLL